ncbi:phosphosulfolactate synthase [Aquabacter spiritensis]|uniref:Phosphosulfolactate synthase n=1 Tax=Aquabacter spiritensis TaxID=933073 RepID=A0A4R3M3V7_9HYPH|nr:phosphosulfolactate synthase [Aquabacter spiritensis]TCT07900.1 phosphosulfolactate synthase [Aquabacter spiritensis]
MNAPFDFVPLAPGRSCTKPRRTGCTMMIDQGLGLGAALDIIDTAGAYVDFAKIKTGTARLYGAAQLGAKLAAYTAAQIRPFIGGQFHEYVFATLGAEALPRFYDEALRLGFATIEISDNVVPLDDAERARQIRAARAAGLGVFAEVGAKDRRTTAPELIAQAELCLAEGAELVLVEAAELVVDGVADREMLAALNAGIAPEHLMFELPGPWIPDVRTCDIEALKKLLVRSFGPDVNVANVAPETVLDFEATRTGLGVAGPPSHWDR